MVEYIDFETAKESISFIKTDSFDQKLKLVVNGVNQKITDGTGGVEPNPELKLLALQWVEYDFSKMPGAKSQKDGDISVDYRLNEDGIPVEFAQVMNKYAAEDEDVIGDNEATVSLL